MYIKHKISKEFRSIKLVHVYSKLYFVADCGSPTSVTDSTYNLNQDKNGTVATYSCDSGYTMIGSASVSCLSPGNWASLPVCIGVLLFSFIFL